MIDNSVNSTSLYHYSSSTHLVYSASSNITKSDYTINYDNRSDSGKSSNDRVVIINFDDSYKSQYTYAKPILDKYGFKATFFVVCNWIGSSEIGENEKMDWQDIMELQREGHDIESHTMTHPHLNKLSKSELRFEIGESKQCLANHGINSTIFAYPYGEGANNSKVVRQVSKTYDLARTDTVYPLTFLYCDQWQDHPSNLTDCRVFLDDKKSNHDMPTVANSYSINGWSHRHIQGHYSSEDRLCYGRCYYYNNSQMLTRFISAVSSQDRYNNNGTVRAIPIIIYHTIVTYPDVSYSKRPVDTTVNLFAQEIKYLHDNGYKVLTLKDLKYNESTNYLYLRGL